MRSAVVAWALFGALWAAAASAESGTPWVYDVEAGPANAQLTVTATFGSTPPPELHTLAKAMPFIHGLQIKGAQGFAPLLPGRGSEESGFLLHACPAKPCTLRYQFDLAKAAAAIDDSEVVGLADGLYSTNLSAWILHPDDVPGEQAVRIRVHPASGTVFATGLFPAAEPNTYKTTGTYLDDLPLGVFGDLRLHEIKRTGGTVQFALPAGKLPVPEAKLVEWAEHAATSVTTYYERFPVEHVLVLLRIGGHGSGVTFGYGGATIIVSLRNDVTGEELDRDWVLTHEMVHTALPSVPRKHHWIEEGLATYIEPLGRLRSGFLTRSTVFHDLWENLPNGLPENGDQGLDFTPTWGRTYWGGALYAFLADCELRRLSKGKVGLEDALRGILAAGGSIAVSSDIGPVLDTGDKATGYTVLRTLYEQMKDKPVAVDLDQLWVKLGVSMRDGKMQFDDKAPEAYIRRAIESGKSTPP